jgi:hypothetical protein
VLHACRINFHDLNTAQFVPEEQAVAHFVEALHHKAGRGFGSRWGDRNFLSDLILMSVFSSPGVHSASNKNEYQRFSYG